MTTIALLESLSADGVLSLGAAAVAKLIEQHVVSGYDCRGISLLCAVACEDSLSIDNGIRAAASDHISVRLSKLLALSQRRIGNTARAVLSIYSIYCGLIEACTLLVDIKLNRRRLVGAVTDVNIGLACGIIDLSAVASLE